MKGLDMETMQTVTRVRADALAAGMWLVVRYDEAGMPVSQRVSRAERTDEGVTVLVWLHGFEVPFRLFTAQTMVEVSRCTVCPAALAHPVREEHVEAPVRVVAAELVAFARFIEDGGFDRHTQTRLEEHLGVRVAAAMVDHGAQRFGAAWDAETGHERVEN